MWLTIVTVYAIVAPLFNRMLEYSPCCLNLSLPLFPLIVFYRADARLDGQTLPLLLRLLSSQTLLYTEMVTTGAIIHGKGDYLAYSEEEHPVALQLGGSDPAALAQCAKLAEQRGYDEINLNVGCPSDRVQNGMFGACLMGNAQLVADCVKAMRDVVSIPVTVKTRIGIDDRDSYEFLCDFINTVSGKGECEMFIIHARKARLSG